VHLRRIMQIPTRRFRLRHFFAVVLLPAADLVAAVSTGSISGRIQNVVTGQSLDKVRVSVKDTDMIAFTDQSGGYRLAGVPGGEVEREVFYTGLDAQEIRLTVTPGHAGRKTGSSPAPDGGHE
jgi:hypothetical protein